MQDTLTIKPMLASKFDADRAVYPCYVQPKIDGVRCLWDGQTAWSRNGKPFIAEIQSLLSQIDMTPLPPGTILDGELYIHGEPFEQIVSAVKRAQPMTQQLRYNVFDAAFSSDAPFADRWKLLKDGISSGPLHLVETFECSDIETVEQFMEVFIEAGFEGLIYRRGDSGYCQGRSKESLLKYKRFVDAEFPIVDCNEGVGRAVGTPIFVCETDAGEQFKVNMEGPYEPRRQMWRDRETLIGKSLTVKFQELTTRGVPRFPIGKSVRDYEGESDTEGETITVTGTANYGIKWKIEVSA